MAMEVVWTRAFTPVLKTQVYSFALIVFTYLGATFLGSWLYRRHLRHQRLFSTLELMGFLTVAAFLPVLINDPRFVPSHWAGWCYPRGRVHFADQHLSILRPAGVSHTGYFHRSAR